VAEVTDATGAPAERYTYDVYGVPRIFDGSGTPLAASAIGNPYLFTGRRYDPESGNYYYRARIYSPELGRFLQMDPLGYADGMNLYAYVGNNPANLADPSGQLTLAQCVGYCDGRWFDTISRADEIHTLAMEACTVAYMAVSPLPTVFGNIRWILCRDSANRSLDEIYDEAFDRLGSCYGFCEGLCGAEG
jgi:RHS repeat-associated protein